jgi:hypothetical protein
VRNTASDVSPNSERMVPEWTSRVSGRWRALDEAGAADFDM